MVRGRLALLEAAFVLEDIAPGVLVGQDKVVLGVDNPVAFAHNQQEHRDMALALAASGYLVAYVLVFPPIKQYKLVKRDYHLTLVG